MTHIELIAAYEASRSGFSSDRVLADPILRSRFLAECCRNGMTQSREFLCRALLNLRKQGGLSSTQRAQPTKFDDTDYRYASEIATRHIERKRGVSLDDILCQDELLAEFDVICTDLAPGYAVLQYRWAALSLRKSRSIRPEILGHAVRSVDVLLLKCDKLDVSLLPRKCGLYVFTASSGCIYVGEASNLRSRVIKHLDHSDIKNLAHYLWEHGTAGIMLELHILPEGTSTRVRRALEVELIRSRNPTCNILGR